MKLSPSAAAVLIGLTIFTVAGFQTVVHRDVLSLTQEEFVRVPLHVTVEVLAAFALCLCGSLGLAGSFKPISPFANQRGLDGSNFRPDFMAFNHRGQLMPLELPPLNGKI